MSSAREDARVAPCGCLICAWQSVLFTSPRSVILCELCIMSLLATVNAVFACLFIDMILKRIDRVSALLEARTVGSPVCPGFAVGGQNMSFLCPHYTLFAPEYRPVVGFRACLI